MDTTLYKLKYSTLLLALFLSLQASSSRADEISDNFAAVLNSQGQGVLKPLSEDLAAAVGVGSFHQGKALGWFPIGFDVGFHMPIVGIQTTNRILADNDNKVQPLWGQVELGLPKRFNVIGRFGELFEADMWGTGLRYGIIDPIVPGLPEFSVMGLYNELEHDFFDMEIININIALSFDVPFVAPYLGAGYDHAKLSPTAAAVQSTNGVLTLSDETTTESYRVEAGINISPLPFTYANAGMGLANGEEFYHVGAGVKF